MFLIYSVTGNLLEQAEEIRAKQNGTVNLVIILSIDGRGNHRLVRKWLHQQKNYADFTQTTNEKNKYPLKNRRVSKPQMIRVSEYFLYASLPWNPISQTKPVSGTSSTQLPFGDITVVFGKTQTERKAIISWHSYR